MLFLLISVPSLASAHTTSCNYGSELYGWEVNCKTSTGGHTSSNVYAYYFTGISTTYKQYALEGIARWNNTGIVNIYSGSSSNYITEYWDYNTSSVAITTSWGSSDGYHKSKWAIKFNRVIMDGRGPTSNFSTGAHEIGHTIGLSDLYTNPNQNKLMYGYSDRTSHYPTTYDKSGATEATKRW